jgi:hypothetical protein
MTHLKTLLAATAILAAMTSVAFAETAQTQPPVPAFSAMLADTGCKSRYSDEKKEALFATKYMGKEMDVTGRIETLDSGRVGLKVLANTHTFDVVVTLSDAKASYDLEKGQRITMRFTVQSAGGCFLPYDGDRGTLISEQASAPASTPQAPAPASEGGALAAIASDCAREWGTDFHMQLWCRQRQAEAYNKLAPPTTHEANPISLPPPPAPAPQQPQAPTYQAPAPANPQSTAPVAPSTLPANKLGPLSTRLAEINQLMRQSLPIAVRHCGSDATCRKEQPAAIHELASKETTIAKAIRNPTTYTSAVLENDTVNACIVMWRASEDFAATMQCINDATPTM